MRNVKATNNTFAVALGEIAEELVYHWANEEPYRLGAAELFVVKTARSYALPLEPLFVASADLRRLFTVG